MLYADPATGFGVVEVIADGGDGARCSGPLSDLVEGQTVRLVGAWAEHPRYGPTFEVTYYEQVIPQTVAGLRSFLLSERFDDVEPEVVERILTVFGSGAGRVIEHEPARLTSEAGVDEAEAALLHDAWRTGQAMGELVRLVEPARIPFEVVRAVHARFGSDAATVAREDPYRLLEIPRVRFAHADALAMHLGFSPDDPARLAAGARSAVGGARFQEGHEFLTRTQTVSAAARLLRVDAVAASAGVDLAIERGQLQVESVELRGEPVEAVAVPGAAATEQALADDLVRLLDVQISHLSPYRDRIEVDPDLTTGQADAVRMVFRSPVAVLTGGPGTGKTRTVQEVVAHAEAFGLNVALCAPTGRAAKRIEELVDRPATTIHRLLEARPDPEGGFMFLRDRDLPLPHDLIVCDEVSMCDTRLAASLVAAVDAGAHLLLVGDPDQLPSVGPGDVLRDVLRSEAVPHVTLTEIHRQAASSRIVGLAREIDGGEVGVLKGVDGDVFLAEERRQGIADRVVEAVAVRAPAYFDCDVTDVQVIAPMYRGPAGVDALNEALKERLNPGDGRRPVAGFHVGDRVMQTRNDADLDVANGDIGEVVDVDRRTKTLDVLFPRGQVTYEASQARELVHAWAITVHKAQGGEWPIVVLVADTSHQRMLWRNLLYTAVTRASRALIIVGQSEAVRRGARHDRPRNRQTALAWRLARASATLTSGQEAEPGVTDSADPAVTSS